MPGSEDSSPTDRESRRAELIAQLDRIEVERRDPDSALGSEILATVADSLRSQIKALEESDDG